VRTGFHPTPGGYIDFLPRNVREKALPKQKLNDNNAIKIVPFTPESVSIDERCDNHYRGNINPFIITTQTHFFHFPENSLALLTTVAQTPAADNALETLPATSPGTPRDLT